MKISSCSMSLKVVLVGILICQISSAFATCLLCGRHAKLVKFDRNNCLPTCESEKPICRPGPRQRFECQCKHGYIFSETYRRCVRYSECPRYPDVIVETTSPTKPPKEVCGPNEEWSDSINLCPHTCEFQHRPCYIRSLLAQPGCQCRSGYIFLNDVEKKCVKIEDCPKKCSKPHFIWNDCGTRCPSTCNDPGPKPCVKVCERGCFCPKDYILDDFKMECVKKDECPNSSNNNTTENEYK